MQKARPRNAQLPTFKAGTAELACCTSMSRRAVGKTGHAPACTPTKVVAWAVGTPQQLLSVLPAKLWQLLQ